MILKVYIFDLYKSKSKKKIKDLGLTRKKNFNSDI